MQVQKAKHVEALTSNYAVAYAVKAADVDVIAVYPITPQTTIVEKLSEFVANGELNAELIHAESEHSALSAVVGAAATGARVFTATSSQGLELAHEVLHIASGMRLPIVIAVPTRAVSAPISIHNDYGDVMNARDTGWVILIAASAQEVYDTVIQAYRLAESVYLPVIVAYDGFLMSHTVEPVELNEEEEVRKFLPRVVRPYTLNPKRPVTMGPLASPDWYYEFKYQQVLALREAYKIAKEVDAEYGRRFGRSYGVLETYRMEDADYAIVTYGGAAFGNAKAAADMARERGIAAGVVRVRLYRPFPTADILKALAGVKAFAVLDRAIMFGSPAEGPLYKDIATAMFMNGVDKPALNVIHGIGQRTMYVEDMYKIYTMLRDQPRKEVIFMGVRI
ncbi:pyruvate ferredoxin oxidoreductase alpha subunit (porA) [Pyrobaculum aerophilum str. IM2]|uniref:2-oxoacid oxidoreductase (ferredoxin) n=2 Tax=Pyrobaculum aerophilum TaxID=13773 RepID=Q8ZXX5_PYRAE|nr:pyruvate ferredoxin oxidoreductase subunit alpha (porA) [Pyrobaculum aerophilum]AAL63221.1 pyruvate ferredoxin oxidoreductase alpha subunit (porA) [Pyrobaculum aerophilum str. IM2]HII48021.1 ferredoxin oxidoreductase [Pyrobaculum aerophilum]